MPLILVALVAALSQAAGTLVGRVLIALGVQYVTYKGFDALLTQIISSASSVSGIPGSIAQYVAFFRLGEAISIVTGAITARFAINGLMNGSFTRMLVK